MALGNKGITLAKSSKNNLFAKTETEPQKMDTSAEGAEQGFPPVRKQFGIPHCLNERLRYCAFKENRKEVDIMREALEKYLNSKSIGID